MSIQFGPDYPTILPPDFAVELIFIVNIIVLAAAIFVSRNMRRLKWLPHFIAVVWLPFSPFLTAILALPVMPPDESPGPGDGFILFPVLGEAALFLMGYALVVTVLALPRIKPLLKFCFKSRKPDGGAC